MPKLRLLLLLLFFVYPKQVTAQDCTLSGTAEWSDQLRSVIAGCDNRIPSPDGKLTLVINSEGQIQVFDKATGRTHRVPSNSVLPPGMASWSPKSDAFFINNGEGSGMSSTFRLFRVKHGQFVEDRSIEKKAVALYRDEKKCSSNAADPNVWGIGWSPDGTRFYLLVQATVNDPCGKSGAFLGVTMNLSDGSVVKQLSEADTKREFRAFLPREIYSK